MTSRRISSRSSAVVDLIASLDGSGTDVVRRCEATGRQAPGPVGADHGRSPAKLGIPAEASAL